jgi:hypothetical protein
MAVDASLLTNNLGEVKYNQVPDISAISSQFAAADQARSQTARNNILAQGDQLEYNNKVGAQNVLSNPDLQGQDLIKAAAPFGETGMKMTSARFGTQADYSKLTSENMDAAFKILPTIVDQASLNKAREWSMKTFGESHLPEIYDELGKQKIQQMGIGLAKIQEQTQAMMKNQMDYSFKERQLGIDQQKADTGTIIAGSNATRAARSGPGLIAQTKIDSAGNDEVEQFAKTYPDHVAALQNMNKSIAVLDKSTNQGGPITGGLAEERLAVLNALSSVYDLTPEQKQTLTTTQNLQKALKDITEVAAITTPVKGKAGLTDADLQFVERVKSGELPMTVENLKRVLRIGANSRIQIENNAIRKARSVKKNGIIKGTYVEDFASQPLKSMLSPDGITLISPDGRKHTFEKPEQAKAAYEDLNRALEQEAKDGSY